MKILVIGGMHGNEPLGIELASRLCQNPIPGIDSLFANRQAIIVNQRFTQADLNRSFPGNIRSNEYELRRAGEIVQACKPYDLVLDFHNTYCPGNDCSFVGEQANGLLYNASAWLGLERIVVADYDCLNKYAPNCISVEISLNSTRMKADNWIRTLAAMTRLEQIPAAETTELFRFVYRISLEDAERLGLGNQDLRAFKPMEAQIADGLGVASPAYPIFIADKYTPYNYGAVLNRIDV